LRKLFFFILVRKAIFHENPSGWNIIFSHIPYEYDFSISPVMGRSRHWWRHQIRVEDILTPKLAQTYPICTGGKGICPPENCGGPWGFMEAKQEYSIDNILELLSVTQKAISPEKNRSRL
jgi:hypothetical protein